MKRFELKNVLITGGSGGVGSAIARRVVSEGGRVVLISRRRDPLVELQEELGNAASVLVADARIPSQINEAVAQAATEMGRIDCAAHCVGSILLKPLHMTSDDEWQDVLGQNLTSAFNVLRAVTPEMLKNRAGSIVCISSAAGQIGLMNHEAVAAAKAGLVGLVRSAAVTYAKRGIRVNAVSPGLVETPMSEFLTKSEGAMKASLAMHPMGRIGTPQDVAEAALFLLSEQSAWITGALLPVDGGMASGKTA